MSSTVRRYEGLQKVPHPPRLGSVLLLALFALPVGATTWLVTANKDLSFSPADITIRQGDAIRFENRGGVHNVHADNNRFRCAVNCSTNTSPSAVLWSVTVQFNLTGDLGYYCDLHGDLGSGMRGIVRVIEGVYADGFEAPAVLDAVVGAP